MDFLEVLILVVSFVTLLALGVPIAFSIGISAVVTMLVSIDSIPAFTTMAQRVVTGLDSFALLAIPFFILAGQIMNRGGIANRLIDFAKVLVGIFPGGLAFVNIIASMLFGAISGSAVAAASAIGGIMHPRMVKEGYSPQFSAAVNITSSTTGLVIPPSNILIVYSLASGGVSIAALFVAGYLPGILTGLALMVVAGVFAVRKNYGMSTDHKSLDILLTLIHLLMSITIFYNIINSNIPGPFILVLFLWGRSISRIISDNSKLFNKWDLVIFTLFLGGILIYYTESCPSFLSAICPYIKINPSSIIPIGLMIVLPLVMRKKLFISLIIQTILFIIAINLIDRFHLISSIIIFISLAIYLFVLYKRLDTKKVFKGTTKYFDAVPSLFLLVVVIGGIVAGIFTATEASAVAVLYTLILAFVYKEVDIKDVPDILLKTVNTSSIVLLLIGTSIGMSWVMSFENIPQNVTATLLTLSDNKFVILLIINLILLFVGIFMDMTPAVLIFTPIFLPVVTALGMDPTHFGIIMVLNLCIGVCTPPVGSVLFVGCGVANISISKVIRPLLPLFIAMIIALMLVTYIPEITLWLPTEWGLIGNK